MRTAPPAVITLAAVLLSACGQHTTSPATERITASAAATRHSDGSIETRDATPEEEARATRSIAKWEDFDRRYPRPAIPVGVVPVKPLRLRPPGIIELADGRTVRMDGVTCSPRGIAILTRVMISDDESLLVVPTGDASGGPIPADVWTQSNPDDGVSSHSSPIESALTNGWCDAESSPTSKNNQRYAALVAEFPEGRLAFEAGK